ncbi:MAG: hypothetical protein CMJ32_07855 [Phycisphaerae bacterium]|nr:hypothetical protein [Phycisphaerae bacterium]
MSLDSARAKIQNGLRDLKTHWHVVRQSWDDPVAHAFQERRLEALEPRVRAAVNAMEQMQEKINQARRHCQDLEFQTDQEPSEEELKQLQQLKKRGR